MRKTIPMRAFILLILSVIFYACSTEGQNQAFEPGQEFKDYWYSGDAELTSYDLDQARYGTNYPGEAVLIFVTEDFSLKKHVKLDDPSSDPDDAVSVLKLNATRQFNTGIYQYNLMRSVFTPVETAKADRTLKVTASVQDWCGHTWLQFNANSRGYSAQGYSYFESEGDYDLKINNALLEDAIWTMIRMNPEHLPTGNIDIVPGSYYLRMHHIKPGAQEAVATLEQKGSINTYSIAYSSIPRTVSIDFNAQFPYQITGWTEKDGENSITTAKKREEIKLPYWQHNRPGDGHLRDSLHLKN